MIKRPKHDPSGHSPSDRTENVIPIHSRSNLSSECGEWLAKVERGLTAQETTSFQRWMTEDAQHSAAFFEMAALWDRMNSLSRLADLFPEPVQRHQSRRLAPLAIAASVLLTAMAAFWALFHVPGSRGNVDSQVAYTAKENIFETAIGEQSTVTLPDGSVLTLNTNSLVRTEFSATRRALRLERGEVHVQVARDPARPFDVQVVDKVVRAVGTEFNLEITDDQHIELIVTEGKVLVGILDPTLEPVEPNGQSEPKASALSVLAGEQAVLGGATQEIKPIEPEEVEVKLSWRSGNLIFRGESLEEAINEIERYTPVEFVILDEDLKKVRVAGLFKAGDVEGLLTTLKQNFDIVYERVGDKQILLNAH